MNRDNNGRFIKILHWSSKYDCCIECGTTKIPHVAKGLCEKCYSRLYSKSPKGKESSKRRNRKYYHSSKGKKYHREYAKSLKGKSVHQNYYQNHKEECKNRSRKWILEHLEEYKRRQKEYNEKYCKSIHGRRIKLNHQRKRMATKYKANFWLPFYDLMWEFAKELTFGYCPNCGKPFNNGKYKLTQDHIIPLSKGGIHSIANVRPMCNQCNIEKNNKLLFEA